MPPDPRPQHELDLLALLRGSRYDVAVNRSETPADRAARIEREKVEGDHRRRKDLLVTRAGIVAVTCGLLFSMIAAIFPIGGVEDRSKAWTILTMIVAGFIGFLTGRQFPAEPSSESRR